MFKDNMGFGLVVWSLLRANKTEGAILNDDKTQICKLYTIIYLYLD